MYFKKKYFAETVVSKRWLRIKLQLIMHCFYLCLSGTTRDVTLYTTTYFRFSGRRAVRTKEKQWKPKNKETAKEPNKQRTSKRRLLLLLLLLCRAPLALL